MVSRPRWVTELLALAEKEWLHRTSLANKPHAQPPNKDAKHHALDQPQRQLSHADAIGIAFQHIDRQRGRHPAASQQC